MKLITSLDDAKTTRESDEYENHLRNGLGDPIEPLLYGKTVFIVMASRPLGADYVKAFPTKEQAEEFLLAKTHSNTSERYILLEFLCDDRSGRESFDDMSWTPEYGTWKNNCGAHLAIGMFDILRDIYEAFGQDIFGEY